MALKLQALPNVHVTFSRHENHTDEDVKSLIDSGVNVAVVFKEKVPLTFKGIKVIDGDKHDRRWEDDKGVIVGLKVKGTNAIKDIAIRRGFAI